MGLKHTRKDWLPSVTKSEALFLLKTNKHRLPRNVVKTIYGQIIHGDIEAAMRGLRRYEKEDEDD